MKNGGNVLINKLFEAHLTDSQRAAVRPDKHTELDPRSHFIYDKYQHRKWYDDKLARRKSTFTPPAPIGRAPSKDDPLRSSDAFNDFFASRTKDAFDDSWHDSKFEGGGNDIRFNPHDDFLTAPKVDRASIMQSLQKMNSQRVLNSIQTLGNNPKPSRKSGGGSNDFNNSISAEFMIRDDDPFQPKTPEFAKSAMGGLSFTRTPKRDMINKAQSFGSDEGDEIILPRKVATSKSRSKKTKSPRDDEAAQPPSRRGSGDSDELGAPRRRGSNDGEPRPRVRRSGSGEQGDIGAPTRRPPARTRSSASDDGMGYSQGRRIRRGASGEGQDLELRVPLKDSSHTTSMKESPTSLKESAHTTGSTRPRREPRRGVARTKSMDTDSEHSNLRQRTRSRSVKRGVRRAASSDEISFAGSLEEPQHVAADASQVSSRSVPKRPPRRPVGRTASTGSTDEDKVTRQMNESISSRQSRPEDPRRTRRSPRESGNEDNNSRTPSPTPTKDSRSSSRRNKSVPRKPAQGNAISISRVPTVRDKGPRSPNASRSPSRQKSASTDMAKLFAASN